MRPIVLSLVFLLALFLFSGCGYDNSGGNLESNAGEDQVVETGSTVTLDGSGSTGDEGDTLEYGWSFVSLPAGSSASLSNTDVVDPTFTADVSGTFTVGLVVSSGSSESEEDTVDVLATFRPVADAGEDQADAVVGAEVQLDGTGSSDQDGDDLTYEWTLDTSECTDSSAALSSTSDPEPTFTPDEECTYTASLVVNDGHFDSDEDSVAITVASSTGP